MKRMKRRKEEELEIERIKFEDVVRDKVKRDLKKRKLDDSYDGIYGFDHYSGTFEQS